MAQLRQDYDAFVARGAEVIVVGPDDQDAFRAYWEREHLPFIGLANPDLGVLNLYKQQVRLLKFGRLPALVVIDKQGRITYQHYGSSMRDIPPNDGLLAVLDDLNQSEAQ
jgi:peroxiredoxin